MANLTDYLYWRGDLSLSCLPFNPVDGLILSWLISLPVTQPLPDTLGALAGTLTDRVSEKHRPFVQALSRSARFRTMKLLRFEEKFSEPEEMQFAALTLLTGDGHAYIAFRGTDASLVGWKENFNMAFTEEVPAQREAVRWLNAAPADLPLRVGGHSKGGNLAVYAAARCSPSVRRRIVQVHNFDGPGLHPNVFNSPEYRDVEPRISSYLPESSIVGILLERSARYHVIRSSATGPLQHDPYSWQVTPDGFVHRPGLSSESLFADRTIRSWLASMSDDQREKFVDALYEIVTATDAATLGELSENWPESGLEMLGAFAGLDLRTRMLLLQSIAKLVRSAAANLQ